MKWSKSLGSVGKAAPAVTALLLVALSVQLVAARRENARLSAGIASKLHPFVFGVPLPRLELAGEGGATSTAQLCAAGRPVVLAVWSNDCPACRELKPQIAELAGRRPDVRVVLINPSEEKALAAPGIGGVARAQAPRAEIARRLSVREIPSLVTVDADCRVEAAAVGAVAGRSLVRMLMDNELLPAKE